MMALHQAAARLPRVAITKPETNSAKKIVFNILESFI